MILNALTNLFNLKKIDHQQTVAQQGRSQGHIIHTTTKNSSVKFMFFTTPRQKCSINVKNRSEILQNIWNKYSSE